MADAKTTQTTNTPEAPPSEQAIKNRLYGEAQRELRQRHEAEFVAIIEAKYAEHGLTYRKRLSPDEKAAKQIADLLQQHPHLRDTLIGKPESA